MASPRAEATWLGVTKYAVDRSAPHRSAPRRSAPSRSASRRSASAQVGAEQARAAQVGGPQVRQSSTGQVGSRGARSGRPRQGDAPAPAAGRPRRASPASRRVQGVEVVGQGRQLVDEPGDLAVDRRGGVDGQHLRQVPEQLVQVLHGPEVREHLARGLGVVPPAAAGVQVLADLLARRRSTRRPCSPSSRARAARCGCRSGSRPRGSGTASPGACRTRTPTSA